MKYKTEQQFVKEHQLHQACFLWFDKHFGVQYRGTLILNHNNAKDKAEQIRLRGLGLRKGHPDLSLLIPSFGKTALHIELKVGTNTTSDAQKKQHQVLASFGAKVVVINSLKEFQEVTSNWIEGFVFEKFNIE